MFGWTVFVSDDSAGWCCGVLRMSCVCGGLGDEFVWDWIFIFRVVEFDMRVPN